MMDIDQVKEIWIDSVEPITIKKRLSYQKLGDKSDLLAFKVSIDGVEYVLKMPKEELDIMYQAIRTHFNKGGIKAYKNAKLI